MSLAPGTRLGPYAILAPLGSGAMGEVYRARDTHLDRDVALKILPQAFATDPDRLARFEREAKTLASLNHAHIAHIHGFEKSGEISALVMELIEGEDLAARIRRGPLPLDEALATARQMADALEAAHDKGIIHRDLKPANIKLAPDGAVKVLDFGLAKAVTDAARTDGSSETRAMGTEAGMVLGTAAYMSPEQARGKVVDKRTDIWAFGCVLVEMLTGHPLYAGDTATETIARVIEREPDLSGLPRETPASVRALLGRCLERDSRRRLRDIGEARIVLDQPRMQPVFEPIAPALAIAPARRVSQFTVLTTAIVAAAAAGAAVWQLRAPTEPPIRRFAIATPGDAPPLMASISPDGTTIAMIASDKLWLQKLDAFAAIEVPGGYGGHTVFWSPDSTQVGFQSRGQLWRVSRDGGQPVAIGRVSQEFTSAGGAAWLPDGHIAFSTGGTSLMEMPVGGGEAQPLFQLDPAKEADIHQPSALPDGRGVLYVLHPVKGSWSIELYLPLSRSRQTILTATSDGGSFFRPTYAPTGHILFQQGSGIWALPFSLSSLQRTGDAFLVADHAREPAISRDGTLVMLPGGGLGADSQLTWIDRTGKSLRALGQTRGAVFHPRVSPDGRLVAATIGPMEQSDLWVFNNENGTERRLTFEAGIDAFPSWSPDGQFIVYQCGASACARRADGAGARVQLVDGPAEAPKLSPDGRLLVFVRESAPGNDDVFVVEIAPTGLTAPIRSTPRLLIEAPRTQYAIDISPDGRFAAYASAEGGPFGVYVTRFPSGDGKWQLPTGYGAWPRWSAKGDRLYFGDELNRIVEVPVALQDSFVASAPTLRVASNVSLLGGFDRALDGSQFILPVSPSSATELTRLWLIQHWKPQ